MMQTAQHYFKYLFSGLLLTLLSSTSCAATLNLSNIPLFIGQGTPPLTMIVLGRNHKLFYEAYNDTSDLNEDGTIDTRYNSNIDYYGYFDSYKCYSYSNSNGRFNPQSNTTNKKCSGQWSGDFLNYLTMSRMDALRKVLYGGYRSTDTTNTTVLERAYIPQDAHSWGKEYNSIATDGYDIRDYTPLSLPSSSSRRHLFASTSLLSDQNTPRLRVLTNVTYRIWEWVSIERPVADNHVNTGSGNISVSPTDYTVRVRVCQSNLLEANCERYPDGNYKPVGLLQRFGENGSMKFGLVTGSYSKNLSGGVLRKNIGSITDEIDPDNGRFTSTVGIIKTIDRIKITGFGGYYEYNSNCGWITSRPLNEGECRDWGNPTAEMLYETLRYFAGKNSPSTAFNYSNSGSDDNSLGLPKPNWQNPYSSNPYCAKPNALIISDITPNYDTDQTPGSVFASFSGDLSPAPDVASLGQTIWNTEKGGSGQYFIGQSGSVSDNAPTAKSVSSFGNIRGLSPQEPTKLGGYYTASLAYYGLLNDLNPIQDEQHLNTFAVALSSPLPTINISVGGKTITILPFGKTIGGCELDGPINRTPSGYQPTNTIVDFYVEALTPTSGRFRVNFEDVEQGADHDMDAIVTYTYQVNSNNTVTVNVSSDYAAGCLIQHLGYIISGTTADGAYLVVRDRDTSSSGDLDYYLDTPSGQQPGGNWNDNTALPLSDSRTFTPGTSTASFLTNPLWYAAKWGSFIDKNNNNIPDQTLEWDKDGDGTPDNYFLVSNPLFLEQQLSVALQNILNRSSSNAAGAASSGTLNTETRLYQVTVNGSDWSGQILSFSLDPSTGKLITTGSGPKGSNWDAGAILTNQNYNTGRVILTYKPSTGSGIPFRWPNSQNSPGTNELDSNQINALRLNPVSGSRDFLGDERLEYLRGSKEYEAQNGGSFRNRSTNLGDIVNSSPIYVQKPAFHYSDTWPSGSAENGNPYSSFKSAYQNRQALLYVGANDGMLHAINAENGTELMAYVPAKVYENLSVYTDPDYDHRFYVDGSPNVTDAFINSAWRSVLVGGLGNGGQGIYALDITDPTTFTEANANNIVLWEFTDADDADLGYTYSQPQIARLANGQWAAIFGNGYNNTESDGNASTTGNAVLYVVNLETGTLIKKLDTGIGTNDDPTGNNRPNGLATPVAVDIDENNIVNYIYAGDLFGNLWKFDLSDTDSSAWEIAFNGLPLFTAEDATGNTQPITTRPIAIKKANTTTDLQIFFGTGKYIEPSDKDTTGATTQTFYGLTDTHSTRITSRSQLVEQTILAETTSNNQELRVTSDNVVTNSDKGWYLDLIYNGNNRGERQISSPIIRNGFVVFTTLIPLDDVCSFGGDGWLMELAVNNGSRPKIPVFDVSGDGKFTDSDKVTVTVNGQEITVPVSGRKSQVGIIQTPTVLSDDQNQVEYKYVSGTSGNTEVITENSGLFAIGRQSWRQW